MSTPRTSRDTLYLQRIGQRWYARIPVPAPLRKELGPYVRKALGTTDVTVARRLRHAVYEEAQARFEETRRKLAQPTTLSRLSYAQLKSRLKAVASQPMVKDADGQWMTNPAVDAIVDRLETETDGQVPEELAEAVRDHIEGKLTITELLSDYLAKNPKASPVTVANYQGTVKLWTERLGDIPLSRIGRRQAGEWLEETSRGKAPDTVKRYVTVMSHLWEWQHRHEDDPPRNPFEGLRGRVDKAALKPSAKREEFTPEELKAVFGALAADPKHKDLHNVALVSLYSGLRLNECLTAERVTLNEVECFRLASGKTVNAARIVPVHPRLKHVHVPTGAKASHLSVQFQRLMKPRKGKALASPGKVFHSLRKNFGTALERAGCPEPIAVRLLGHAPISMSYRVYSGGQDVEELRAWVEKVTFPSFKSSI